MGGLPSKDRPAPEKHIDILMDIAKDLGKKLEVHVDQENNPYESETEMLAAQGDRARPGGAGRGGPRDLARGQAADRAGPDHPDDEGGRAERDRLPVGRARA